MEKSLQALNTENNIQLWTERIRQCRTSGLTVRDWCRNNEVSHNAYYYWQKKLFDKLNSQDNHFAEIPLKPLNRSVPIAKLNINGIELEIYPGISAIQLSEIISGLKQC